MLYYVHQLVSYCVCLLFAAKQVVYSEFLELFLCCSRNNAMRAVWVNQNSKVIERTAKQWAETFHKGP